MNINPINYLIQSKVPSEVAGIFNRGKAISVRNPSFPSPVLGIIQSFNGGFLYFRLSDELMKDNVHSGEPLSCQIIEEGYEYVLNGTVGEIQSGSPQELKFIIKDINIYKNMRKFRRHSVDFAAELTVNKTNGKTSSIVHNISVAGLNMVSSENFDINDRIDVALHVNNDTALRFNARITRVSPGDGYNEYGLRITEIDGENRERLEKFIGQLESNEERFVDESKK